MKRMIKPAYGEMKCTCKGGIELNFDFGSRLDDDLRLIEIYAMPGN